MNLFLFCIIVVVILQMAINSKAQTPNDTELKYQRATQELESVLNSVDRIDNPLAMVKVKAKAATLVWLQSPEKARTIFTDLWSYIDKQSSESFNKEEAQVSLLKQLYSKDRKLANQLLQKAAKQKDEKEVSGEDKVTGNDPKTRRLAFLANRLADSDVTLAAQVFGLIQDRTSPITPGILSKIREKDPQLANYLASQALDNLSNQPRTIAVIGLTTLASYIFPLAPVINSAPEIAESDENLNIQFMSVGYPILKESLAETDDVIIREQLLAKDSLNSRPLFQTFLAAILATLAPRYAPEYALELNETTTRLIKLQPPFVVDSVNMLVAAVRGKLRINPDISEKPEVSDAEIIAAISKGEFREAESLIRKLTDESKKKTWTQTLLKAQSKQYISTVKN